MLPVYSSTPGSDDSLTHITTVGFLPAITENPIFTACLLLLAMTVTNVCGVY